MENEEREQLSVGVATVVERFIAELLKTNQRVDALEMIVGEQQVALRDAVTTITALIEGKRSWPRPGVAKARSN